MKDWHLRDRHDLKVPAIAGRQWWLFPAPQAQYIPSATLCF